MAKYFLNYFILLFPAIIIGGGLAYAGDPTNGLKLGFLSLLGCWLIAFYHSKKPIIKISAWIWWFVFTIHALILSSTWLLYNGSIDAYFVLQSLANTSQNESLEFIQQNIIFISTTIISSILFWFIYIVLLNKKFTLNIIYPQNNSKKYWILPIFFTLLGVTAWAIKPIRVISPPVFWVKYHHKIDDFKAQLLAHKSWQQTWLKNAQANVQALPNFQQNQTIILIISESLTSYNVQACGYPRPTTPNITQQLNELTVFCQAYSGYPNTLGAIKAMLTDVPPMQPDFVPTKSVLADAKVAGFKIFWLSNQDDAYLSSLFGSFADSAVYNNKRGGRSSMAKDEELLPEVQAALKDSAPKKLIVVHMIGSHPNYSARYPQNFNLFPSKDNQVEQQITEQLNQAHASMWVKHLRDEYDNSVAYQDHIFNQIFQLLQQDKANYRGLIFLSDHGNEVGHVKDFAGHSPNTEAGYRIPVIMWDNRQDLPKGVQNKAIDATQLDNNLLHMMGLSENNQTTPLWTDENYSFTVKPYWQNPTP